MTRHVLPLPLSPSPVPDFASLPLWLILLHGLVLLLALATLVATLLPLLRATAWWIRVFDFPRLQIVALALIAIGGGLLLGWHVLPGYWGPGALVVMVAVVLYQWFRIMPYTRLASKQVGDSTIKNGERHLSLTVMNVLQFNQQSDQALQVLRTADSDVIMAVETDRWWQEQLKPLEATHPHTCYEPRDNTYGLLFYSRLPLDGCQVKYLVDDDVPSLHTRVQLRDGRTWVRLYGLHPKPPAPAESKTSTRRDAELLLVGKEIEQHEEPTIVFGDMNDVAWSHTSELFRRISSLLDPRVGRGLLPTFHADYSLLRWPLDHVFVSAEFKVDDMERLPYMGSDHFPIYIKLSYEPHTRAAQEENAEEADAEDHSEAHEKIQEGFKEEEEEEQREATQPARKKQLTT
jgi:endonuclease/exonuclease/phosphatase (EEP) superfamily protein YafD